MIKDFLIISCTGKNDSIGLRINNIFFIEKIQMNIKKNDELVSNIIKFLEKHGAIVDKNFRKVLSTGDIVRKNDLKTLSKVFKIKNNISVLTVLNN